MRVLTIVGLILLLLIGGAIVAVRRALRRLREASEAQAKQRAIQARRLAEGRLHAEAGYVRDRIRDEIERERTAPEGGDAARMARLVEIQKVLERTDDAAKEPFPVSGPCAEAIDAFRAEAGDRELLYSESGDGRWLRAVGDRALLRWAVLELFRNTALHAGEWSRIALLAEPVPGAIALSVRDDGAGLDRPGTARLYSAFTPRAGSPGPGLGMYVVRRIVERSGGTIEARSAPGGGLLHRLRLPHPPEGPYGDATAPPRSRSSSERR